jgi:hypothetical protein
MKKEKKKQEKRPVLPAPQGLAVISNTEAFSAGGWKSLKVSFLFLFWYP